MRFKGFQSLISHVPRLRMQSQCMQACTAPRKPKTPDAARTAVSHPGFRQTRQPTQKVKAAQTPRSHVLKIGPSGPWTVPLVKSLTSGNPDLHAPLKSPTLTRLPVFKKACTSTPSQALCRHALSSSPLATSTPAPRVTGPCLLQHQRQSRSAPEDPCVLCPLTLAPSWSRTRLTHASCMVHTCTALHLHLHLQARSWGETLTVFFHHRSLATSQQKTPQHT